MNTVRFNKKNTLVIAHRGLSGIEKENTNAAFVAAGNRSYYGIETDIYRTADGHFGICHDKNLFGLSGVDAVVEDLTLSELQNIVLYDKDGTKNRIDLRPPTLENYISICKRYEKRAVLELKSEFTEREIGKIVDIINEYGYIDNLTFISFKYQNLVYIRKALPTATVQFLFERMTDEIVSRLIEDKIDVDVYYELLNEDNVKMFHDAGLKVNCWTVDNPKVAEKLADMGVDFITTNILE